VIDGSYEPSLSVVLENDAAVNDSNTLLRGFLAADICHFRERSRLTTVKTRRLR
jgi:hypothetical protein